MLCERLGKSWTHCYNLPYWIIRYIVFWSKLGTAKFSNLFQDSVGQYSKLRGNHWLVRCFINDLFRCFISALFKGFKYSAFFPYYCPHCVINDFFFRDFFFSRYLDFLFLINQLQNLWSNHRRYCTLEVKLSFFSLETSVVSKWNLVRNLYNVWQTFSGPL